MIRGTWFFPQHHPFQGVTVNASAFRHTLAASGFEASETLARESIQNSVDAAIEGRKPRVRFHLKTLHGSEKSAFVEALGLYHGEWNRRHDLEIYSKARLEELTDKRKPIKLLYIDDFETTGLYGEPFTPGVDSPLKRLLLELGNDAKATSSGSSGGSFGFGGKSVFLTSGVHSMILAYSVFDPARDNRRAYAQLMGVGYLADHTLDERTYTAFPEFAKIIDSERRTPWTDEEAQDLADRLGFFERTRSQTGTSILIPGATVDLDAIRKAIELWWWPRLIEKDLDIELYEDDVEHSVPRPTMRPELKAYRECFQAVSTGAPKAIDLSTLSWKGQPIGRLALTLRSEEVPDDLDEDDEPSGMLGAIDGIALVRSPRMVVEYYRGRKRGTIPSICQGVFVADSSLDVDNVLRLSENAAHNTWDPKSERLFEVPDGETLVDELLKAIRKQAREFARKAQPPPPPSNIRIPLLENLLAEALRSGKRGGVHPGPAPAPVHITHLDARREVRNGQAYLVASPRVELEKSAEAQMATIEVTCVPKEEGRSFGTDRIPVHFADATSRNGDGSVEYLLLPGNSFRVAFEAGPYDPEWSVDYRFDVRLREKGTA